AAAYFPPRPQVSPYAWGSETGGRQAAARGLSGIRNPELAKRLAPTPTVDLVGPRAAAAEGVELVASEGQAEASPGWDGGRARRSTRGEEEGRGLPSRRRLVRRVTLRGWSTPSARTSLRPPPFTRSEHASPHYRVSLGPRAPKPRGAEAICRRSPRSPGLVPARRARPNRGLGEWATAPPPAGALREPGATPAPAAVERAAAAGRRGRDCPAGEAGGGGGGGGGGGRAEGARATEKKPMGSERPEMRKRQMPAAQETAGSTPGQPGAGERGANACCFCWCCCCSCSCLTVRNQEQRPRRPSHELREEDLPSCEESPSPTLEEVNAWSQSFDKVMLTPAGRNAFREFLRTEFSEENMLFWMACEELKKEANKTIIEEKARTIYEDYISILSPKEVSLDSRVREVINRNMVEPSQHIFDDAQLQIYTLMHRDSYPRFMNSALYKDLLQSLSEKSAEA
uniref:Regulator of G protein signaling 20 n=3 Tax=Canis lupus familiaris TaxID=9615 RepID=A0A8I3PPR9_CANLF